MASPEEKSAVVKAALARRRSAKAEDKEAESKEAAEEERPHAKAKGKAKAKEKAGAKSKTKNEKAKGKADTAPASTKEDGRCFSAQRQSKGQLTEWFGQRKPHRLCLRPRVARPSTGTERSTAIAVHSEFLNAGDRCDKKVKIVDEENSS